MSSAISAPAGRRSTSWFAATAITPGPRRWRGASASASATSSAWPEIRCCSAGSALSPRTLRWVGSAVSQTRSAGTANSATRRKAGTSSAAPASRLDPRACPGEGRGCRRPLHRDQLGRPAQGTLRKGLLCEGTGREPRPSPGQALIKAHKLHLASDGTSCTKATANQFRLLIQTAAYWLMLTLRGLAPRTSFWRDSQFDTIRLCLIKVAGRVTEMVTRGKIALPTAYPYRTGFAMLAG